MSVTVVFESGKYLRELERWAEEGPQLQAENAKLRAEVERLIKINQECEQEAHIQDEILRRYKTENAKLRKVVEAAREFISSTGCNPKECGKCDPKYIGFCRWSGIGQALAEYDKTNINAEGGVIGWRGDQR